jgi:diketogulonate reductase-like aldo/keto reductase
VEALTLIPGGVMEYQMIKGEKVPSLGLGTYRLTGEACERAVERGLSLGYRHLDTAQMYGNEAEVGRGIRGSGVDRGEIFVTTKVWPSDFAHERVIRKTRESLEKLGTDYVDLVLYIGVSNFSPSLVEEATGHAEIFCNQVQYHPYRDQNALLDQAQELDYLLTAYTPLSRGGVQDDATLEEIGEAHGKSATQVALRWLVQQDKVSAIPKATSEEHLGENLDVFDFELSEEEMDRISSLSR